MASRVSPIKSRKAGIFVCIQGGAWLTDGETVGFGVNSNSGAKLEVGTAVRIIVGEGLGVIEGIGESAGVGVGVADGKL